MAASARPGPLRALVATLAVILAVVLAVVLVAGVARLTLLLLQRNVSLVVLTWQETMRWVAYDNGQTIAASIGVTLLALGVDVVAHECGHILGAALVGFRFVAVRFGMLNLRRTRRGLRWSLTPTLRAGGHTIFYPTDTADLRLRYGVSVALGPVATLLLALAAAALLDTYIGRTAGTVAGDNALIVLTLACISVASCLSFVENLVPMRYRGIPSDGMRLLTLALGGPRCERMLLLSLLSGYHDRDVPPRDQPAPAILRLLALAQGTHDESIAAIYAYTWALDCRDIAHAAAYLSGAIAADRTPGGFHGTLAHEIAFFTARYHRRPDIARAWFARGSGDQFGVFMRPRAEAAILLAEYRYPEALACAAGGLVAWQRYVQTADHPFHEEERDLREMLAEAQRATAGTLNAFPS